MNAVLAKNVKTIRDMKHWTQQHLAETAGILLRTVQRVERGDGASLETLGALASAFDVTIDFLQTDMEAFVKAEEELRRTHDLIEVKPVTCSSHVEAVGASDAYFMQCASEDDTVRDAFADLASNLKDMGDLWDDAAPAHHREWVKEAFEQVVALNQLGVVVSIGKGNRALRVGKGTVECRALYVIAWPKGQEKSVIAIPKDS